MKNKKIIALVCAISMIFSMFASFTVVSAAEQGIALEIEQTTATKAVITAKAVGYPTGISSSKIAISVPEGATTAIACPMKSDAIMDTSIPGVASCTIGLMENTAVPNDVLAIFTVTMTEALPKNFKSELVSGSQIAAFANDTDEEPTLISVDKGTLNATSKWIEASKFEGTTVALNEKLSKDTAASLEADNENVKDVYVAYEAKKGNAAADYGTDYVAYYNGTQLTKDQLNAYLTGKFGSIADAIEKVTFTYKSGVAFNVQLVSVNSDDEAEVAESGTIGGGSTKPTPKPTPTPTAGVKVTADKTEISSDGSTRVNATVTDAEGATPGTEVKFTVSSGADVLDFDGATEATVALADGKASVRVYAKKVGTATVKAAYTYTDKDGAEQTKEGTVTIRVKNTTVGGGSGSDDKKPSGGGSIAGPSDSMNPGGNWLGAFTDLDSVEWAKPSILALSLKGIVSGRGDGTFAPNDNITRAEYCQILIGAIEKSAEYADSEFADVPSDAWFYHAVSVASKYGIVSGYGDGNFGPYDLITRQDMALMTYKAAQVMNKDLSAVRTMSFADAGAISAYAAEAVQTLADANIINGVSDTEFAPKANATRAQAAKILYDTFVKIN